MNHVIPIQVGGSCIQRIIVEVPPEDLSPKDLSEDQLIPLVTAEVESAGLEYLFPESSVVLSNTYNNRNSNAAPNCNKF